MNKQIIGLIGGMGPFASARFLDLLLEKSAKSFGAKNGEDFPEIILDSVPVPDFISDTKSLPIAKQMLVTRVQRLSKLGCTKIAMVCNTGHVLFPELSKTSNGKMISLIEAVRDRVVSLGLKRVGILATTTTIRTSLFKKAFLSTNVFLINPEPSLQKLSETVIRSVIANKISPTIVKRLLSQTKRFIKNEELDAVILGCTELPLVFAGNKSDKIIDCLDILSDKLLKSEFSN